jgi:fission 1 protein
VLRKQYESEGSYVGVQTKFNYAWGLIKSTRRGEQQFGVRLLTEIFRDHVERRRECLYYLALGHYRLGNYAEARRYNDILLENEPTNSQALSLRGLVDDKVARGMSGMLRRATGGEIETDEAQRDCLELRSLVASRWRQDCSEVRCGRVCRGGGELTAVCAQQ